MSKSLLQSLAEGVGAALIVAGIALWSIPAALIAAGIGVLLIAHPIPTRGPKR